MSGFEKVVVKYGGDVQTIPPQNILRAIAVVEDHFTFGQFCQAMSSGSLPVAKITGAYVSLLAFCGITADESEIAKKILLDGELQDAIGGQLGALFNQLIDEAAFEKQEKAESEKKQKPQKTQRGKKSTKST